ncbi:hypothetical protein K7432_001801 [Basidiobolus ranarum]|uniref:RCC1-like domain-containing protein n=1 Tax=Basidiobolus ranarum TaxID=34480 RepID=A0ABR2X2C9_9FUNG
MGLLGIGSNGYGQLSLGHGEDTYLATDCVLSEGEDEFYPSDIAYITGGGNHTAVVTNSGVLYLCGQNSDGQLGLPLEIADVHIYKRFSSVHKWKSVACGWNHTLALTSEGVVYSFGNNAFLQLGNANDKASTHVGYLLPLPKVKQISCGLRHSMAVTEDGHVYSWGANRHGQTGQKWEKTSSVNKVEGLSKVKKVVCGQYHSVVLTETSQVYVFGLNKHGLLGISPQEINSSFLPVEMIFSTSRDMESPIVDISSGWNHITVLDQQGHLYTWGRNDHFQLGMSVVEDNEEWLRVPVALTYRPQRIPLRRPVIEFVCGSEHTIALCENDECFTWGWNEHGNCGTGNVVNVSSPTLLLNVRDVKMVACGYGQTFIVGELV